MSNEDNAIRDVLRQAAEDARRDDMLTDDDAIPPMVRAVSPLGANGQANPLARWRKKQKQLRAEREAPADGD